MSLDLSESKLLKHGSFLHISVELSAEQSGNMQALVRAPKSYTTKGWQRSSFAIAGRKYVHACKEEAKING